MLLLLVMCCVFVCVCLSCVQPNNNTQRKVCISMDDSVNSQHALDWLEHSLLRNGDEVHIVVVALPVPYPVSFICMCQPALLPGCMCSAVRTAGGWWLIVSIKWFLGCYPGCKHNVATHFAPVQVGTKRACPHMHILIVVSVCLFFLCRSWMRHPQQLQPWKHSSGGPALSAAWSMQPVWQQSLQ